ncbi:MAG: SpoIIE family protein phosphatase, partial [Propionibacteriaceae bacterium]|nr:SpoIIE family protein phosphatase [Propionibacteriaceae bacterium]
MSTKATSPAPIVADMTAESREPAPRWPTWARIIAPVAILLAALLSASLITAPIMLLLPYSNALESGRNLVASVLASVFTVALLWLYLSFVERRTLSFTGFRFTKLSLAMFGVGALASAAVLAAAAAPATATGTLRPYATDFEGVPTALVIALLIAQEVAGRTVAVQARESERRERLRLESLSGLAQRLSAALTPDDIGRAVVDEVLTEAGATAVNLGVISAGGQTLDWVVMAGYPPSVVAEYAGGVAIAEQTVATDAARTGRPVVVRSAVEYIHRYPAQANWVRSSGAETVVGWPLIDDRTPIGAVLLVWSESQPLDAAQLAYVSAVAAMVTQALVRARVYAAEDARATVLQAAVLPDSPAEVKGLELCVVYEPADVFEGLGGDWYDTLPLPGGRTYLAVGDVVGHGLPAVEDMAQLRSAGRALAHQGLSPGRVLAELNGFTRHASLGKFATMVVAITEPDGRMLAYASAGHPPPLVRRNRTDEVVRLDAASGPVLGPMPDADFPEAAVSIECGDILLMYTDGLVER